MDVNSICDCGHSILDHELDEHGREPQWTICRTCSALINDGVLSIEYCEKFHQKHEL